MRSREKAAEHGNVKFRNLSFRSDADVYTSADGLMLCGFGFFSFDFLFIPPFYFTTIRHPHSEIIRSDGCQREGEEDQEEVEAAAINKPGIRAEKY